MNAKTRSAEVFFSLGSSENVLTPGVDSQFYDTIFVFFPAAAGAREPANLSRGQADSEGKKQSTQVSGSLAGPGPGGKATVLLFFSKIVRPYGRLVLRPAVI